MRILIGLLILTLSLRIPAQGPSDKPFQVLIANGASVYGVAVEPLQYVDDVTSIEVAEGGFLSLVHSGGTTYEHTEKIFTFYLKPHEARKRSERPSLEILYQDQTALDESKIISVIYPPFDRSGYLEWSDKEPFEVFWYLPNEPVLNYKLTVSDGTGRKIQDFRTSKQRYLLKPETYGLSDGVFSLMVSSTFAGETIESKTYTVQLQQALAYPLKATDLVLKALELEPSPVNALEVWQQVLEMPNGQFYKPLFVKFLLRNGPVLTATGQDVELLLSQNR